MLYTIGHSNHSFEVFLRMLRANAINCIVDVRSNPSSRYVLWANRPTMFMSCHDEGIKYMYGGDVLGGRSFIPTSDPVFQEKLGRVVTFSNVLNVAMMCSEADPMKCHRAFKLSAAIHRLHPETIIKHILRDSIVDSREFEMAQPNGWVEY